MVKFADCSKLVKWVISAASLVSAVAVFAGAAAWAADTRYQTLVAQAVYVQSVSDQNKAAEIRQLQREIFQLELKDANGTATAEDRAMSRYLQRDLDALKPTQ